MYYIYIYIFLFLATMKLLCGTEIEMQKTRCITDKRITGNAPSCSSFEISKPLQCSRMPSANLSLSKVKEMAFKALLGLAAIIITEATDGPSFAWLLEGRGY